LVPLKAASCSSQALCLFVERVNFLIKLGHLGFRRIFAAQLLECLPNGKFGCFSHGQQSNYRLVSRLLLHGYRYPAQTKRGLKTNRWSAHLYNNAVGVLKRRYSSATYDRQRR
jgi:hypothetical protein